MRIPIARQGYPFIFIALLASTVLWLLGVQTLSFLAFGLMLFVVWFFRDPEREIPEGEDSIIAPADGRVIRIERVTEPRLLKAEALKISIFMNVFNVHVNRTPAAGRVVAELYNHGKFFSANLDKASLENEQNALLIERADGKRYMVNQIAGLVARRIVCYVTQGAELAKGERFGMIRFGSRVEVFMPPDSIIEVNVGDRVKAGTTVLGYWPRGGEADAG